MMHLNVENFDLTGKVPGIDSSKFQEIATKAKEICPI